jgi:hypothetical protein
MIKNKPEDFIPPTERMYGIYRGVVEDRNDPKKAGRVKVRVWGVHSNLRVKDEREGIPVDELPWAEPAMGLIEGSVSGFGLWSVPLQGSHVFVFFENGHIMQPRYFATVPGIPAAGPNTDLELGFQDPDGVYPIAAAEPPLKPNALNEPDFHRLARGEITSTIVNEKKDRQIKEIPTAIEGDEGPVKWNEPLPSYAAVYPENIVLATHAGIVVEIDNTIIPAENENETEQGKRRVHIYHPSHTYVEITEEGDIILRNERDSFEIVTRNKKIYIKANEDKTIDLTQSLYVKKDREIKVDRHETKTIAKDLNIDVGNEYNQTVGADKSADITGDESKNIGGKLEITIGADADITIGGNATVSIDGGAEISAGGVVNVFAAAINLN